MSLHIKLLCLRLIKLRASYRIDSIDVSWRGSAGRQLDECERVMRPESGALKPSPPFLFFFSFKPFAFRKVGFFYEFLGALVFALARLNEYTFASGRLKPRAGPSSKQLSSAFREVLTKLRMVDHKRMTRYIKRLRMLGLMHHGCHMELPFI